MKGTRLLTLLSLLVLAKADYPCNARTTNNGTVCVCNSTYCDTVPTIRELESGQYQLYSTSKTRLGFSSITGNFSNCSGVPDVAVIIPDTNTTYQSIIGFGGAFTDATGINILRLSNEAQQLLLQSYFGKDGIQYSLGRVPIGGTDFSTRSYTYCDAEDVSLLSFALQDEDYKYKIPFIKKAVELRGNGNIRLFASAWTAPKWMKTNNEYAGTGRVKDEYYKVWAEYYLKFFEAYEANNVTFWGLTTQNEPFDGLVATPIQSNGFTSGEMKRWILEALGPAIRNSSYSNLKIMLHDDQRTLLPILYLYILSDREVIAYADGIALHWYTDSSTPASFLNLATSSEKKLFRLATEACNGYRASTGAEKAVELGSWDRAEKYLDSIIEDLQYDFGGWVDWNMVLSETGGPSWIDNEVDSPVIVNGTADEFYKQPMFYALGHFSKFIVTDSVRINTNTSGNGVTVLAFIRPDGKVAVILRNSSSKGKTVKLDILGSIGVLTIEAQSINTLLYKI